ncbi:hypothetical protein ABH922_002278 [Rhodococcus sp. 27YEA15]
MRMHTSSQLSHTWRPVIQFSVSAAEKPGNTARSRVV